MGYPVDTRITRFPVYASVIEMLKPVKGNYEGAIDYDTRR